MMRRLSSTLLYVGAGICALGAIGIVGGMWVNLPPVAVRRIAMALPFVVGGALFVVGAVVGRATRRKNDRRSEVNAPALGASPPGWTVRRPEPPGRVQRSEQSERS